MSIEEAHQQLVDTGRRMAEKGLVLATGGNISVRVDDSIMISERRADLGALAGRCVVVPVTDDGSHSRSLRASSELPLHRAIYRNESIRAVVHTHSTYAVVMSTLVEELPAVHYAQAQLGGVLSVAPYARFGTEELAHVTESALRNRRAALMRNHGVVAVGKTLHEALEAAELTEWLSRLAYLARIAGGGAVLDGQELAEVAKWSAEWGKGR